MSFRLEEKIFIPGINTFELKKWIFSKGGKILYPGRLINSIYFDNNLKMYLDSVEGITPRKKIRIRSYGNKNFSKLLNFKKEIKISLYNYRDKIVENIFNKKPLDLILNDIDYGICSPILNVIYFRNYYILDNRRITLDEKINYYHIKNKKINNFGVKDSEKILEIKSTNINEFDFLRELFPQPRSRFSKYCRGIELLGIY